MDKKTLGAYHAADLKTRREIEEFIYNIADPQTRDMFYLHFIAGYTYRQTAEHIGGGITKDCVFMRVKRFMQKVVDDKKSKKS
jgi:DNA-directed RNA polymerase specialized sigma24 family protein